MINSEVISVKARSIPIVARPRLVLVSLLVLAAALRLYAISLYPLAGDEYGSLAEAQAVGLNWNSILYSSLMHFWIRLGSSEMWLRLPAAIFGVASVAVLYKVGEKLGGFPAAVVAALFAATSPFNLYHAQEVRFYSFFILTTVVFMLATISYVSSRPTKQSRAILVLTAIALFFSHFVAPMALYVQGGVAASARLTKSRKRILLVLLLALPVVGCVLLLTPALHHALWLLYRAYGNAPSSAEPAMTPVSLINLGKIGFAGFIFTFGYHVYPLRVFLVVAGLAITGFLLLAGFRRLWKETNWGALPVAYVLMLVGIYVVFDSAGGRLANGVAPRHVAFVWPMFLILTAIGATSFKKPVLYVLVGALLLINGFSICAGWQKEWTYGNAVDYRAAAEFTSRWITKDAVILHDGRSKDEIDFYFPKGPALIYSGPYTQDQDLAAQLSHQRVVFVTDDWEPERRRDADRLLSSLHSHYTVIASHVDYPFFEYVLERRQASGVGYEVQQNTSQIDQPLSNYGVEFQDLHLPVALNVKDVSLTVNGAYGLPDLAGNNSVSIPLARAVNAERLVLLSTVTNAGGLEPNQTVAEISLESGGGKTFTIPVRIGADTMRWNEQCTGAAQCETVFQWRKRLAIVGQNGYDGALREFSAGLHGVVFPLPAKQEVTGIKIRYVGNSGQLYIWGLALPENH